MMTFPVLDADMGSPQICHPSLQKQAKQWGDGYMVMPKGLYTAVLQLMEWMFRTNCGQEMC